MWCLDILSKSKAGDRSGTYKKACTSCYVHYVGGGFVLRIFKCEGFSNETTVNLNRSSDVDPYFLKF